MGAQSLARLCGAGEEQVAIAQSRDSAQLGRFVVHVDDSIWHHHVDSRLRAAFGEPAHIAVARLPNRCRRRLAQS